MSSFSPGTPDYWGYEPQCIYIRNADAKKLIAKMFRDKLWFKCFFPGGLRKKHRCMMWVRADTDLGGLDYEAVDGKGLFPR